MARTIPLAFGARLLPPDPLAIVPSWAQSIGVTRVARVTGLDRCGVDVACAIRPAGHVLQVSNGKGATFREAKASALSEALELWSCENVDPGLLHWLREEPTEQFWPNEFLGGARSLNRNRSAVQPWAKAERLDRSGEVYIPASRVWCPPEGAISVGLREVSWTANGIGAHPDPMKARLHGLLELLEREALCRVFPNGWLPEHLETRALRFTHEKLLPLMERGMRVHCVDATPDRWPIPVVAVLIADADTRAPPLAAGYACRRTGAEAAEAAFFEACQSRLTEIHGAREDVAQTRVEIPDWVLEPRRPRRDVTRLPAWSGRFPALLKRLGVAAAAVDLSRKGIPVSVARVFVPGFRISDLPMTKPLAVAFLGPSLPVAEAKKIFPRALVRGPARQGDVLKALREKPRAIVLIDGVFESQPSVWHQELRVALSEGVHVLGASSMGALRAVELAPFGMIGIGAVFRAYAEGRVTDDSDVALLHASAEHDHRPLTVAFVNVVATVEHAIDHGALSVAEARSLLRSARSLHYQDRYWPDILARVRWSAVRKAAFDAFRRTNPQDIKAADARECLAAARELCKSGVKPTPAPLTELSFWARRAWIAEQGAPPESDAPNGLRTLLLAEWSRSSGLEPMPDRVAFFARKAAKLNVDAGLARRWAEALALEEQVLRNPGLLAAQAPSFAEGSWLDRLRQIARRVGQ